MSEKLRKFPHLQYPIKLEIEFSSSHTPHYTNTYMAYTVCAWAISISCMQCIVRRLAVAMSVHRPSVPLGTLLAVVLSSSSSPPSSLLASHFRFCVLVLYLRLHLHQENHYTRFYLKRIRTTVAKFSSGENLHKHFWRCPRCSNCYILHTHTQTHT